MADFKEAQKFVLRWEGGYCNDADDPGGATNFGVSIRWLQSLPLADADVNGDGRITVSDIRSLTEATASELFRKKFWDKYNLGEFAQKTALVYYDAMVNTGPAQATKFMQRACNEFISPDRPYLAVDGALGPLTRAEIQSFKDSPLFLKACIDKRDRFYRDLASTKPKFKTFLKGWLNRTKDLRKELGLV